jgi:hypothetical protein
MVRLLVFAVAFVLAGSKADAARSRLSKGLRGLKWGATVEDVKKNIKRELKKRYRKLFDEAEDALERRTLQKRLDREYQQLTSNYTKLDGQRTGLEVGIAADEFRHGSGESVLLARGERGDRYYFFIGGKLWKIFRSYSAAAIQDTDFPAFLEQLRGRFGRPARVDKVTRGAGRVPARASWQDRRTFAEARDRTQFFQSFTLSFADLRVKRRIDDTRGKPVGKAPDSADTLIEMATGDKAPSPEPAKAPKEKKKRKKRPVIDIF